MIKVAVSGCLGRMGSSIIRLAKDEKEIKISGALEQKNCQHLNKDVGEYLGLGKMGVVISCDLSSVAKDVDCVIDFTSPESTMENLEIVHRMKKKIVIGTTGLSSDNIAKIKNVSKDIAIVYSSNMSVGVNLLLELVYTAAKALDLDYQTEIVEMHHKFKKDSPSGTALSLAQKIADARGLNLKEKAVYGRSGKELSRQTDEIGIHALRAGGIVGEHSVIFCSGNERVELTHIAYSRDPLASGAIKAAKFLRDKKSGLYNMSDVLFQKKG